MIIESESFYIHGMGAFVPLFFWERFEVWIFGRDDGTLWACDRWAWEENRYDHLAEAGDFLKVIRLPDVPTFPYRIPLSLRQQRPTRTEALTLEYDEVTLRRAYTKTISGLDTVMFWAGYAPRAGVWVVEDVLTEHHLEQQEVSA